jgi:hypothetical protein
LSQHELQALPQLNPTPANTATTNWPAPLPPHNCETQDSYLLPQFEGIDAATGDSLYGRLAPMMGNKERRRRLQQTLNAVLGLELSDTATHQSVSLDDFEDEPDFEQPES